MSWPNRDGGGMRIKLVSSGSMSKPIAGDVLSIVLGKNIEAAGYNAVIDRGAGFVALTSTFPYVLQAADIPPVGAARWPIVARAIELNLVSDPFYTANPPAVPGAPTINSVTPGNAQAVVAYTAPASNGGATITNYITYATDPGGNVVSTANGLASPHTLTGLTNGVTYSFRTQAVNSVGPGALSAPVNGTPAENTTYSRYKAAMAAVAGGTGYARVAFVGDSTTAGARSLGPAANALRTESPVVYVKTQFNLVQARPTIASSWVGDQSFGMTNALSPYAYDPRLSIPDGASWTFTTPSPRTAGGSMLFNATNDTKRLGFLPEVAVDTVDVYYPTNATLGSFTLSRTGATDAPVSQIGTSGSQKITFNTPLGSVDPIYAQRTSVTGSAYISAMDAYNSTIKSVRLYGVGWSGGKVADWIASVNGFDPLPSLVALHVDLAMIRPGINDAVANTNPATFKSQLLTLVDALIADGTNVALATHYPSNVASASQAIQDVIAQQVRDVATLRGLSLRDTYAEWGSWVAANALGDMADNLHPNKQGYTKEAVSTTTFLLAL